MFSGVLMASAKAVAKVPPFRKLDGTPFLEAHHIRRLTDGGPDDIRFMGGVCPNCHRAMHYGAKGKALNAELQRTVDAKEADLSAALTSPD